MTGAARLLICQECRLSNGNGAPETGLREIDGALDAAGLAGCVRPELAACMNCCGNPVTVALQGKAMASYVFSGVSLAGDIDDIVATCRVFAESPDGVIEDARACGRLRELLVVRLPPIRER